MKILPLQTPLLKEGDDLASILCDRMEFQDDDILVISSKAVATILGEAIDLSAMRVTPEAEKHAAHCGKSPAFIQAVLQELERMHGNVVGWCPGALLTEVQPDGLPEGSILTANAGVDESNVQVGFAIGWPKDPVPAVRDLRLSIEQKTGKRIAVIMSDSCCHPRRHGVTAFALVVSGLDPLESQIGKKDLFAKELRMTQEAVADQLATAANFLMGNGNGSTPAAVIRDHGLQMSTFEGWVPGIPPDEDLFKRVV